jgi:hypothetical protein
MFQALNMKLNEKPCYLWLRPRAAIRSALKEWKHLIKIAAEEPMKCTSLVPGDPDFIIFVDASGGGAGGVLFGGKEPLQPTVFRLPFPDDVTANAVSDKNKEGQITNSDLEMAAILLGWLTLEGIVPSLRDKHIGIYSENTPSFAWTTKMASKRSKVAGKLIRALTLRQLDCMASPLVTLHIAGIINDMADIPSRSFGYKKEWEFKDDSDFANFFSSKFPLPNQRRW